MIKQSKSGEMAESSSIELNETTEAIISDKQGNVLKGNKWQASQIEAKSTPLVDEGKGKPYLLRQFEFSFNPETIRKIRDKKIPIPTQQEIFNSHWPQIRSMLWGDGLVAIQESELPPRIVMGKKKYRIFVLCQPKTGVIVNDPILRLQDIMKNK